VITRLPFAAPFTYSTRGTSDISRRSQRFRDQIKGGSESLFTQIALRIAQLVGDGQFTGYFGPNVVLVPVPGHAPLAPGAVLLTSRIVTAMVREHVAGQLELLLERGTPVEKSATAPAARRPTARTHFDSLIVRPSLAAPERIVVVDDFVTRGAMLVASASKLQQAYPAADIRGFALVRSISGSDIDRVQDPCEGFIELSPDGQTWRRP
jgi:hypothetical protein